MAYFHILIPKDAIYETFYYRKKRPKINSVRWVYAPVCVKLLRQIWITRTTACNNCGDELGPGVKGGRHAICLPKIVVVRLGGSCIISRLQRKYGFFTCPSCGCYKTDSTKNIQVILKRFSYIAVPYQLEYQAHCVGCQNTAEVGGSAVDDLN